jgi:hypothetical protein
MSGTYKIIVKTRQASTGQDTDHVVLYETEAQMQGDFDRISDAMINADPNGTTAVKLQGKNSVTTRVSSIVDIKTDYEADAAPAK